MVKRVFLLLCMIMTPFQVKAENSDLAADIKLACSEIEVIPGAIAACVQSKDTLFGARLTNTYDALKRYLPAAQQSQLVEAQRAWLTYVKATCALVEYRTRPESHSWALVNQATCNLRHTLRRLEELNQLKEFMDVR